MHTEQIGPERAWKDRQNLIAAESIRAEQERKRGEALARCIESWRQHVESRKPKPTQAQLEAIQDREFRSLLFDMQLLALLQVAKAEQALKKQTEETS